MVKIFTYCNPYKKPNCYILLLCINLAYCANFYSISREERIIENIKPLGQAYLAAGAQIQPGEKPKLAADAGMKRYKTSCYVCHDTGASGAPKLGNASEWTTRIKAGKPALYDHAINGYKAMPAKGACLSCSDEEIKMTVDYMLSKSQ